MLNLSNKFKPTFGFVDELWTVQRRWKAHGEMYMPRSLYRISGSNKTQRVVKPEFRPIRAKKVLRLNLPTLLDSYVSEKMRGEDFVQYSRKLLREIGLEPCRPSARQTRFFVGCSNMIIDAYKPPENEGSFSELRAENDQGVKGALKSKLMNVRDRGAEVATNRWRAALKKIRAADPDFDPKTFGETALKIYIDAHKAMQERNQEKLHDLVTEHAYPSMWSEMELKSLRWEYVQSLEPPSVVNLRQCGDSRASLFGQATVRIHSQQKLAVFDQFGRLFMGSEEVVRDVLEYVVFENYLSNEYGSWRLHGKIGVKRNEVPKVLPTYRKTALKVDEEEKRQRYGYKLDEATIDGELPPSASKKGSSSDKDLPKETAVA